MKGAKIQVRGGNTYDDVKQFILVSPPTLSQPSPVQIASIFLKRNIVFGTRKYTNVIEEIDPCVPLLRKGIREAGEVGDQPQGLATVNGLGSYVRYTLRNPETSPIMEELLEDTSEEGRIIAQAIRSIVMQVPREGHTMIGLGTYHDAQPGWEKLVKEYVSLDEDKLLEKSESHLFRSNGGILVGVEFAGTENEEYLAEAGGSMARFFF